MIWINTIADDALAHCVASASTAMVLILSSTAMILILLCSCFSWGRISTTSVILGWRDVMKYKYMFIFPQNTSARQGFNTPSWNEDKQKRKVCVDKKINIIYYSGLSNNIENWRRKTRATFFTPAESDEKNCDMICKIILSYFVLFCFYW